MADSDQLEIIAWAQRGLPSFLSTLCSLDSGVTLVIGWSIEQGRIDEHSSCSPELPCKQSECPEATRL